MIVMKLKVDQQLSPSTPPPHLHQQEHCHNCNVTFKRRTIIVTGGIRSINRGGQRERMALNFAVPFVLINLICSSVAGSVGSGRSSSSSFPNEANADASITRASAAAPQPSPPLPQTPLLAGPRLLINIQQHEEQTPGQRAVSEGGGGSERGFGSFATTTRASLSESAGNSPHVVVAPTIMARNSDIDDYVQEEPIPMDDIHLSSRRGTAEVDGQINNRSKKREQPQPDFQDHFYAKFKEKDVPVPFSFGNFKRQQQHPQSAAYQQTRGRSSWAAAAPGQDSSSSFTREITIKQGRVKGVVRAMYRDSGLRDVDQFLGLPYAESPVGTKRFMPPGAPPTWPGVRMASKLPPVCPQKLPKMDMTGGSGASNGRYNQLKRLLPYLKVESEDCLYLNLYVPRVDGKPMPRKYPVMVFIHGESYEWNSGNAYDGSVLASYGQVIVITLNYRLGILGFMRTSITEHSVSNIGLLDQVAALHWIKGNIGAFGGDNSAVTLMGHGTGAALVNLLMVSPVANGLFHRAILMSGSALSDWAITTHALQSTLQVTQALNCPLTDNQKEVLSCLGRKRYQEIVNVKTADAPEFSTSFGPVIDGLVIPNEPHVVMGKYSDLFSRYDLMFGVTELESYHQLNAAALEHGLLEREKNNLLRFYMQNRFEIRPDVALGATVKEYTESYTDPKRAKAEEHRETLLEILSDARVVSPLIQAGVYHAKVNPRTYMYVFGHNSEAGDYSHLPLSVIGEELAYVFGAPLCDVGPFPRTFSAKERLLSEATMKYWSNFAKTGNPKAPWKDFFINLGPPDWQKYDVDWTEYEPINRTFLNLGLPPVIQHRYRDKYANFWNERLPEELRNVKNLNISPPYADYYPASHHRPTSEQPSQPRSSRPAAASAPTSADPFIDGRINLFPNSDGGRRARPTGDPYELLRKMGRHPDVMAHPETQEEARGSAATTERIIIVGADIVVERADVTLYLLSFMVVLLLLILLGAIGVFFWRAYRNKSKETVAKHNNRARDDGGGGGTGGPDRISSDVDESYVMPTAMKCSTNKYESMNFCRNLLQKYHRRRVKKQVFSQSSSSPTKVAQWMTTEELAKYSPRFESKSSLNTRHSSFLGTPPPTEKVSVAIDATPHNRSDSVLRQEPIEITKAKANYLHTNSNNERIIICREMDDMHDVVVGCNDVGGARDSFNSYSSSSTCSDVNSEEQSINMPVHPPPSGQYEEMMEMSLGDDEQVTSFIIEQEDINVTCRDESPGGGRDPLSPMETLENLQRRKFPKVLPDYPEPKHTNRSGGGPSKRHSLPSLVNSCSATQLSAVPIDLHHPLPALPAPLHTATLGRRGSNHRRYRPPSRMFVATSETRMAAEPPELREPPTTSSTLIVGPLVKKSTESLYTTLRRGPESGVGLGGEQRKMMPLPSVDSTSNSSNDSIETVRQMQL